MALTLRALANLVDELAPFRLAYEWDNVGLQVGNPAQEIARAMIALEVNGASLAAARKHECQAMIVHHPLLFSPVKTLLATNTTAAHAMELIRAGIGLIVAHTNLDRVVGGTNGALAAIMELTAVKILEQTALDDSYKLTVFVPREYTPAIIEAINRGGGGWIGNYSHCTFRSPGVGTYRPESGAAPFIGEQGKLEQAEEDRLETVVSGDTLRNVLQEVRKAHPYEEVAYDVYPLKDADPKFGLGVVGKLPVETTVGKLAAKLAHVCRAENPCLIGDSRRNVSTVAVISGSAGKSVRSVRPSVADVLVTGELGYHHQLEAVDAGLPVIMLGHAGSERVFASHLRKQLAGRPETTKNGLTLEVFEDFPEPAVPIKPESDKP